MISSGKASCGYLVKTHQVAWQQCSVLCKKYFSNKYHIDLFWLTLISKIDLFLLFSVCSYTWQFSVFKVRRRPWTLPDVIQNPKIEINMNKIKIISQKNNITGKCIYWLPWSRMFKTIVSLLIRYIVDKCGQIQCRYIFSQTEVVHY